MEEIEIWKSLDFLGYDDYEISTLGRVKSLNYGNSGKEGLLKPIKLENGYLCITLCKNKKHKIFLVHRLVCLAFLKNPENLPCVNHKDESRDNNCVENLEWVTPKENINYGNCRKKISEKRKGFRFTKETIQKMSDSHKGKKQPLEVIDKIREQNSKAVLQYSLYGVFIKEWKSVTQASKELNISHSHISECCNGKRKTCGNFMWRFKQM